MRKTIFAVSFLVLVSALLSALIFPSVETFSADTAVIIDAGHGIPDGGAVAADGTTEAELNLQIAKKLYDILSTKGIDCIMTRSTEDGIYTEGNTIHAKKVSDIRNRVELARGNPNAFMVSIHMNTFPSQSVRGAQVFYKRGSDQSKAVAAEVQNVINLKFQSDNAKVEKQIPENIYLFNHIDNSCILIECGFLTNSDDLSRLKDAEYQNSIAESVSEVLMYKLFGG